MTAEFAYRSTSVPGVESDLLQWLPEAARRDFDRLSLKRAYEPGQPVFQHGDTGREMYRVLAGTIRVSTMRSDGQQMVYALLGPGECIATSGLIDGAPLPQTAEALTRVRLQALGALPFARLRETYREFDDALLRLMSYRMRTLSGFMASTYLADLPCRVALRLLHVAQIGPEGRHIATLTQSELALLAGLSRQTINRVLNGLACEGVISVRYGTIEIHDLDALSALSELR